MTTTTKFLFAGLITYLLACSSCDQTTNCTAITIDDSNYFMTDQTLTDHCNGVDYIIKNGAIYDQLSVEGNLVIEAGVTVQFENNGGLAIEENGSIKALGTASAPITLRGEEGGVGDWRGIILYSGNTTNQLSYTTITGGGSQQFNSNGERGNLIIYADSKISIDNCTFANSPAYGINANYYTNVDIRSLRNNTFQNNNMPLLVRADFANVVDGSNKFPNNTDNVVHVRVGDELESSTTWSALDIPYRLTASSGGIFPDQEVINGATLTLEAGLTLEFEANTGLYIRDNAALNAVGTASAPITFTGANKVAGFWDGLYFSLTNNPLNQLTHVNIEYAGGDSSIGAISMWARPNLALSNVSLKNISGGCAIYDSNGLSAGTPTNPNYTAANLTFDNVGSQFCD